MNFPGAAVLVRHGLPVGMRLRSSGLGCACDSGSSQTPGVACGSDSRCEPGWRATAARDPQAHGRMPVLRLVGPSSLARINPGLDIPAGGRCDRSWPSPFMAGNHICPVPRGWLTISKC